MARLGSMGSLLSRRRRPELEGDFNVVEAGMAWGKVKDQDFIGKEAHVRHREEEPAAEEQLRDMMAIGIDSAIHLVTDGGEWDPQATAQAIAALYQRLTPHSFRRPGRGPARPWSGAGVLPLSYGR